MLANGEVTGFAVEVTLHRIGRLFVLARFQISGRKTQMVPMKGRIDREALLIKPYRNLGIPIGNRFLPRFPKFLCRRDCRHREEKGHFLGKTKGRTPKTRAYNSQSQTGKPPTHVLAPKGGSEATGDAALIPPMWVSAKLWGGQ